MRSFTIAIVLSATLIFSALPLAAQSAVSDWSALKVIASGSKLEVKLKNGNTVKGKLISVSDTTLSLSVKNKPVAVTREDVASVYQTTGKSATAPTLIGLAVGAGAGAAIGAAGGSSDNGFDKIEQAATAGLAVVGAGVGALAGFLIARGGANRVLIYEAK